jgi:hypothetical protein
MTDDNAVQAAVVLQLLGRVGGYPRADLDAALKAHTGDSITAALDSLAAAGVVQLVGDGVHASEALRRLDELGLIAV